MKKYLTKTSLLLASAGFMLVPAAVQADDVADFYSKERIQLLVGSSPGGGYDTYARTLARHYPNHVPGSPDIIVQNRPGAGSIVLANFIYNVAPKDGTVIGALQRNAPMVEILGQKGPKFDPEGFNWLGSLNNEAGVLAVNASTGVESFDEVLEGKQVIMGASGPNDTEIFPSLLANTLGANFQLVLGYPSATGVHLGMERGEVDGVAQSWSSFKLGNVKRLENDELNPLLQLSLKESPELTKMGVPMVFEYINEENVRPGFTVERVETLFSLMLTSKAMGRPYALGPDIPKDRVKALRAAFMNTAADPAFVKDANKQGREVVPVSGDEIQGMIQKIATANQEVLDQLEDLIKYKGEAKRVEVKMVEYEGEVLETNRGGREIVVDAGGDKVSAGISGSRTDVMIGGKDDDRGNIKTGMTCVLEIPEGADEAKTVSCEQMGS